MWRARPSGSPGQSLDDSSSSTTPSRFGFFGGLLQKIARFTGVISGDQDPNDAKREVIEPLVVEAKTSDDDKHQSIVRRPRRRYKQFRRTKRAIIINPSSESEPSSDIDETQPAQMKQETIELLSQEDSPIEKAEMILDPLLAEELEELILQDLSTERPTYLTIRSILNDENETLDLPLEFQPGGTQPGTQYQLASSTSVGIGTQQPTMLCASSPIEKPAQDKHGSIRLYQAARNSLETFDSSKSEAPERVPDSSPQHDPILSSSPIEGQKLLDYSLVTRPPRIYKKLPNRPNEFTGHDKHITSQGHLRTSTLAERLRKHLDAESVDNSPSSKRNHTLADDHEVSRSSKKPKTASAGNPSHGNDALAETLYHYTPWYPSSQTTASDSQVLNSQTLPLPDAPGQVQVESSKDCVSLDVRQEATELTLASSSQDAVVNENSTSTTVTTRNETVQTRRVHPVSSRSTPSNKTHLKLATLEVVVAQTIDFGRPLTQSSPIQLRQLRLNSPTERPSSFSPKPLREQLKERALLLEKEKQRPKNSERVLRRSSLEPLLNGLSIAEQMRLRYEQAKHGVSNLSPRNTI